MTTYGSGAAFRRALEDRLLARSVREEIPLVRLPKLVAFERLLARLMHVHHGKWLLKGGLALQLRFGAQSRTTKDIDVLLHAPLGRQAGAALALTPLHQAPSGSDVRD